MDSVETILSAIRRRRILLFAGASLAAGFAALLCTTGEVWAAALSGLVLALHAPMIRGSVPDRDSATMRTAWAFFGLLLPMWSMVLLIVVESFTFNFARQIDPRTRLMVGLAVSAAACWVAVRVDTGRADLPVWIGAGVIAFAAMNSSLPLARGVCIGAAVFHAALACSLGAFALRHPLNQREAYGLCRGCGYDLRGLAAGRCPECGAGIDVAA